MKSSIDGYADSHFMACPSVAAATEIYHAYSSLSSKGVDPWFKPATTTTGCTPSPPIPDTSDTSSVSTASESSTGESTGEPSRPMQPFSLDETVSNLTGHECYWVTWAAVRPGVFFGM